MGLLDPATSDGRVIFFLPWEGKSNFCILLECIYNKSYSSVVVVCHENRRQRTVKAELCVFRLLWHAPVENKVD